MKTLYLRTPLIALLLIIATALCARAQDSRIQLSSLDHLAAKASQTVDVSIDERLIRLAAQRAVTINLITAENVMGKLRYARYKTTVVLHNK